MSIFSPGWKSINKAKAYKSADRAHGDKNMYRIVLESPWIELKKAAIKKIKNEKVLLDIINADKSEYTDTYDRYNFADIKLFAFRHMNDERLLAEAVPKFNHIQVRDSDYIDKIMSEDVLCEIASKRFEPSAFEKIKSDEKQLELANMNPQYTSHVRNKYSAGWIKLLLNGKFDEENSVKYAKKLIKKGYGEGVVILSSYIKKHPGEFRGGTDTAALDEICELYEGSELWAHVGLLGFFPKKNELDYCVELIESGDLRGLDIILKNMEEDPQSIDSAASAQKLIEIYKKARKDKNSELTKRIEALPAKEYGEHRDGDFHYCDYVDHEDKGYKFRFDPSEV